MKVYDYDSKQQPFVKCHDDTIRVPMYYQMFVSMLA